MIRERTWKTKEALQQVLVACVEVGLTLEELKPKVVHCIVTSEEQ